MILVHWRGSIAVVILGVALAVAGVALSGKCDASALLLAQDQPAAPSAAPSETKPKLDPVVPKNLEPLSASEVTGILGKKVKGPDGKELGLIVDVIVDRHGHPRAAVIDFGGFLGVGSRKIAIDWQALNFSSGGQTAEIELSLNRDDIQNAPEYKADAPTAVMVGTPPASSALPDVSK
jgi:hypothetical protein